MAVSTLFATTASTEMLNGTIWCKLFFLPSLFGQVRVAKQKLHPRPYRLANIAHYDMSLHEQSRNPHMNNFHNTLTPNPEHGL